MAFALIGFFWFGCGGHDNQLPPVNGSERRVNNNSVGVPAGRATPECGNQNGSSLRSRVQPRRLRRSVLPCSCFRVVKGTTPGIKMDGWTESATTTGRRDFAHREGHSAKSGNNFGSLQHIPRLYVISSAVVKGARKSLQRTDFAADGDGPGNRHWPLGISDHGAAGQPCGAEKRL